jgi:c-di-GMP-binding flagellar brake protein YcgR
MVRERRRYFRRPLDMSLRITLPNNHEQPATATNLSEGGMAIRLLGKLSRDTQAQLRFTLPSSDPSSDISLELKGQVAWADGTGRAGIRFVDVSQNAQHQLEKWLTDRLQEEIPAKLQGYVSLP